MTFKLETYLSGGAANADPDLSLGGAKSSIGLSQQSVAYTSTGITGVTLLYATGLDPSVSYNLGWNSSDDSFYLERSIGFTGLSVFAEGVSGDYFIPSPSSYDPNAGIVINYDDATFNEAGTVERSLTITNPSDNLFDEVSAAESLSGDTSYRCIYLENGDGTDIYDLSVFIAESEGVANYAIGLDPAGVNVAGTTIADENTAPAGVVFSTPDLAGALTVQLTPGDYIAVWFRRTVVAGNGISSDSKLQLGVNVAVS